MIILAASFAVISEYTEVKRCVGGGYRPEEIVAKYTEVVLMFFVQVSNLNSSVIESINPEIDSDI